MRLEARLDQVDRLGAHSTAHLQDLAARGVCRVGVEQLRQGVGLVAEAAGLVGGVAGCAPSGAQGCVNLRLRRVGATSHNRPAPEVLPEGAWAQPQGWDG
ncbi:hypothetical protein GCM10010307_14050 [Streptomyces vastus]|uniref:Uncharacterized protein n=1 Tax=Streptomyces vastus TaxID=285451 RepID=A0ABP6CVV4_9ACTN